MLKIIEGPKLPLYARFSIFTVFVIWFALAGGAWAGRQVVTSDLMGSKESQVEFRNMPEPRARPWVKVDPELERELEELRAATVSGSGDGLLGSTVSEKPTVMATPQVGKAVVGEGKFLLQFGAFNKRENAERLIGQLQAQGQKATIEKVESKAGVLFRVKGPNFDSAEKAERLARNLRTQSFQVFVVGE